MDAGSELAFGSAASSPPAPAAAQALVDGPLQYAAEAAAAGEPYEAVRVRAGGREWVATVERLAAAPGEEGLGLLLTLEEAARPGECVAQVSLASAMAESCEARVVTGLDSTITHVNEAWCDLCGFTPEEVMGDTLALIQGPETDVAAARQMVDDARGPGGRGAATLTNYRASGEAFQNYVTVVPAAEEAGQPATHFLGVLTEVPAGPESTGANKRRRGGE